uniref:HMG box domain-containing protein n=1 Tax=Clastoptera arizonana TaxID=38151 RepID=A0A1B6EFG2_9HEMI
MELIRTASKYHCAGPKRKYKCHRKRKATTKRCCPGSRSKVTLCNRNWRRISVKPFVNFLRDYRKLKRKTPLKCLVREAKKIWCKMNRCQRKKYVLMACRARKRGYRT